MHTKYLSPNQKQSPTTPTKQPISFIRDNALSYSTNSSYSKKSQEIQEEDIMRQELNYLKNRVYYLESKMSQQTILIEQLQSEIKVWSNIQRQEESKELSLWISQWEMKLKEEQRKDRNQIYFLNNTLFQSKAELESKIMCIEEQVRATNRQIETNCKMFFNTQEDVNTLHHKLKQISIQNFKYLQVDNNQENFTYFIDKQGYLIDNQGHYILDENNLIVRLSIHQLEKIKKQFKIELDQ